MKKKFYAIRKGYDFKKNESVKNKIVDTWAECLLYVHGAKGAEYKSFQSRCLAEEYISGNENTMENGQVLFGDSKFLNIYVDGSFNISTERYAYAFVAVKNNIVQYVENGVSKDSKKKSIRQVAGELEAAVKAAEYSFKNNEKHIVILHDYAGVANHVTGAWERKSVSSVEYYNKMKKFMDSGLDIKFSKVSGHSGDLFNDIADEMAKEACEIESKKVVEKWIRKNKLEVVDLDTKLKIESLAGNYKDNIVIAD